LIDFGRIASASIRPWSTVYGCCARLSVAPLDDPDIDGWLNLAPAAWLADFLLT
jgi:hypothetical protein